MRRGALISVFTALALTGGCSAGPTENSAEQAEMLPAHPTAADLVRPRPVTPAINGDHYSSAERGLYHCPGQPDLDALFASLWAAHRASLEAAIEGRTAVPGRTMPPDPLRAAGCTQHRGIVAMARIIDWSALDNRREANWDRWIAFDSDPPTDGFYLLFSGSID